MSYVGNSPVCADGFPSGTRMLFQQAAAPIGWVKETAHNDKALRVVSGTPSSGGSVAFSTAFGRVATDAHALTVNEIPSHTHPIQYANAVGAATTTLARGNVENSGVAVVSSATGGNGVHSHNIDLRVSYVDVILAVKA